LVNPAKPKFSVIGVYNLEIARIYQYLLQKDNREFTIVHGLDGYDEISLTGDSKIITKNSEEIYTSQDLGYNTLDPQSIAAGETAYESAKIFKAILEGNGTFEQNAVVIANAAVALYHTKKFGKYEDCLHLAQESLESGKALLSLNNLIN
jgi:anthranilate phosphoribosyltransferase